MQVPLYMEWGECFRIFDDNSGGASTNDLATEIERLADELETVEDPLQIANLIDDIDDVISKLEI